MKTEDISTEEILRYLAKRQGEWTCLWYGGFEKTGGKNSLTGEQVSDVYLAMPPGTPHKLALSKMKNLHKRGLVGGCPCGCRGDFEITDKGLALIGEPRTRPYNGY